ncbi:Chemotaxis protein CheY [Roseivivax sp. THAF40]|uniref:response regulator n=1 Tax=unclassified Roseivivax TaxID=2639302 RepID=UPI0012694E77|nr:MULTISPECIES: response regulator [unclassified Roseivivax]QFS84598.1 Chemotaxis protein CheY [Roseivivax sp. THAF197b]QFT48425.1 Chemotaxis protein CheY [Roseivivax sp. THAF40]
MKIRAKSVLLVEDNDFDVKRVTRAFAKLSDMRQIVRARDGVEALDIIRGTAETRPPETPFVIVLDLNMPRMGGIEFLETLRASGSKSYPQVFVVTTSDYHVDVENAYQRGVSGYFVKPETAEEMITILEKASQFWDLCEIPK